jgi:RNA polymerase sigma factor (TIGR02999 family)
LGCQAPAFTDQRHFFVVAARAMRRILVDYARRNRAGKRGGGEGRSPLHDAIEAPDFSEYLEISECLEKLEALDARAAQVIELRFFGGLTHQETARVLDVSVGTIERDWIYARAWLCRALSRDGRQANQ